MAFDSVVDLKLDESKNVLLVGSMHMVPFDPEWRNLRIAPNFEVTLEK